MNKKSLSTVGFLGFIIVTGYGLYSILSRLQLDPDIFNYTFDDEDEFDDN